MQKESRMYLEVESRNDWINVEGCDDKFYPHPVITNVFTSRSGLIASRRISNDKLYLLVQGPNNIGYMRVGFWTKVGDESVWMNKLSHKLILETFVDKPDTNHVWVVDHIDNDKKNNSLSNLQWLTRGANLKKRDELGSLYKSTFVFDRVTDTLVEYPSRQEAAKAINLQTSNLTTAIKYANVVRGRYFITDEDVMTSEDYYYLFKEYDLKKESKKVKEVASQIRMNKISERVGA